MMKRDKISWGWKKKAQESRILSLLGRLRVLFLATTSRDSQQLVMPDPGDQILSCGFKRKMLA